MTNALIVEDDRSTRMALSELFEQQGFSVATAADYESASRELQDVRPDMVVLDVVLPDGSGLDLLLEIPRAQQPYVLLMSGEDSVRRAVDDMALRRVEFLHKPVEPEPLVRSLKSIRKTLEQRAVCRDDGAGELIGDAPAMQELRQLIDKVAPTELAVYVEGESGTGKELIARSIHRRSERAERPFVAINCGALPESLVDSELFGHEKGSFTGAGGKHEGVFEQADGGTLFFDEITEMPTDMQVRLLRTLETGAIRRVGGARDVPIDVRVIAASNRRAEEALESGHLRKDLYHRLCVFPLESPPLRDRMEDILPLARHFLAEICEEGGGPAKELGEDACDALVEHSWPGNVRQLRNAVQRAFVVAEGETIRAADLPPHVIAPEGKRQRAAISGTRVEVEVGTTIEEMERALIEATLESHDGDKRAAAKALGISLRTLYNRLKSFAEEPPPAAAGENAG